MNYQLGKIYKIVNKNGGDKCYIGSTCELYLCNRYADHTSKYRNPKKRQCTSSIIFDLYGLDNCTIEKIEDYPCNEKCELLERETEIITQYGDKCVNIIAPIKSREQIKKDMKQPLICECGTTIQKAEKARHERTVKHINYLKTIGIVKDDQKTNKIMCECGNTYGKGEKKRHCETSNHINYLNDIKGENTEELVEKSLINKEKNNERDRKIRDIKITCECGSITNPKDKNRHCKTQKHQNFIKTQTK